MANIKAKIYQLGDTTFSETQVKTTFKKMMYEGMAVDVFGTGKASDTAYYPTDVREATFFYSIEDCEVDPPSFIETPEWEILKKTASCFISGNGTLMPKMVYPTCQVCNNGIDWGGTPSKVSVSKYSETFNWSKNEDLSDPKFVSEGIDSAFYGTREQRKEEYGFVSNASKKHKNDDVQIMTRAYDLNAKLAVASDNYVLTDSKFTIGDGPGGAACAMSIAFVATKSDKTDTQTDATKIVPKSIMTMGTMAITLENGGTMGVEISESKTTGSLSSAQMSAATGQSRDQSGAWTLVVYPVWNGVVTSSGIQDSSNVVDIANFYCKKNLDVNMGMKCDPLMSEYPYDYPTDVIVEYDNTVKVDWGTQISMQWIKAMGTFAYTPVFFVPKCRWSVFFRAAYDANSPPTNTYTYKAYNIYSHDDALSDIKVESSQARRIPDSELYDGTACYRLDFSIENDDIELWGRRGLETWGFILATTESSTVPRVKNSNGTFALTFGGGTTELTNWYDYITDISITLNLENCSGNINLDKYAMMVQTTRPDQSIGGIKITMEGGNENVITGGLVFSGIAMEVSDSSSESTDSLSVSIFGLEKKLEDIKLVNAPFWDGDLVGTVANWIGSYAGIKISFEFGNYSASLPRSVDFEKPAVNFVMGTSAIDALRKIAYYTNHTFVIQKDAVGYFYLNNEYGIPQRCYNSAIHTYTSSQVVSIANNPTFVNMYNAYMTVGLIGQSAGGSTSPLASNVFPYLLFDHTITTPDFPWSRIFVSGEQGYLTEAKMEELHHNNMKIGSHYMMTGSVVVPGNASIDLFDRIKIDEETYYVHSITHSMNFQSKEWTTSLQTSKVI